MQKSYKYLEGSYHNETFVHRHWYGADYAFQERRNRSGILRWTTVVESQIAGGVSALIAAGTTGEPSTMTWDEHVGVIRVVAERAKDRACVIAGTGSNCTREVIHAANVVKDFGVAAQLVVTPYYNKSTQEGLVAHYTEIAEKTALPIVVYNASLPHGRGSTSARDAAEDLPSAAGRRREGSEPRCGAGDGENQPRRRRRNLRPRADDDLTHDPLHGAWASQGVSFRAEQRHARRNRAR